MRSAGEEILLQVARLGLRQRQELVPQGTAETGEPARDAAEDLARPCGAPRKRPDAQRYREKRRGHLLPREGGDLGRIVEEGLSLGGRDGSKHALRPRLAAGFEEHLENAELAVAEVG